MYDSVPVSVVRGLMLYSFQVPCVAHAAHGRLAPAASCA
jgi:hypothetical protein